MNSKKFIGIFCLLSFFVFFCSCSSIDFSTSNNTKASTETTAVGSTKQLETNTEKDNMTATMGNETTTELISLNFPENTVISDSSQIIPINLNTLNSINEYNGIIVDENIVNITAGGTYILNGILDDGQILITAPKSQTVYLLLNNVDITNKSGAAIYCEKATLIITLVDESVNKLMDGGQNFIYADEEAQEPNAALFAKNDLMINGNGSLDIIANFNNGIGCKDELVIVCGNIKVSAKNNSIRGNDSVIIIGGIFNLKSSGDGICTNESGDIRIDGGDFTIDAYNDGIQAGYELIILNGTFDIKTGGGWPGGSLRKGSHATNNEGVVVKTNPTTGSYKGLKSTSKILIYDGIIIISAYDDAIHSDGSIIIYNGKITVQSGDDGIHCEGELTIKDGEVEVLNSFEGIEGKIINLNGGFIIVNATDDGLNASGNTAHLSITGGEIYVNSGETVLILITQLL